MKEIECRFCGGKGKDPFQLMSERSLCQVCGGDGKVQIKEPVIECVFCKGTGIYPATRLTCTVCGGKGVITNNLQDRSKKCLYCTGTGRTPHSGLPCSKCSGTGIVEK